jgi:hypothetical protein
VEWHCRDLMPEFGYEPRLSRSSLRYFMKPIRGERPKEFFKSRAYSLRDRFADRRQRSHIPPSPQSSP